MPFYATPQKGDPGHFPNQLSRRVLSKDEISADTPYTALTKQQLIELCEERGMSGSKGPGSPLPRNQKVSYYIERLKAYDQLTADYTK